MDGYKFNLGQACIIRDYNIEAKVISIWHNIRDINIKVEVEYLDKNNFIRTTWLNEVELDFIVKPMENSPIDDNPITEKI